MTTAPAGTAVSSTTPILDRLTPAPPPAEGSPETQKEIMIILLVVGVFMTAGFVWLLRVTSGIESSFGPGAQFRQFLNNAIGKIFPSNLIGYEILLPFIFSWLALFAAVAVHELGHLLAGVATRFRLLYVQLGRVQIRPPFHVKWRRKGLPGATGFTAMVPVDARKLRLRALIMLFGGPAANLIT
ncbi:MAG TPA: hypothetical protein VKE71_05215, partial [Candidatus Angelobacter sp.]|nr:hypothetical protein [Candidatus Angelobacter sp.]